MPYRITPLVNGEFYHIYNRGLGKQPIFSNQYDYTRFIKTLFYYQLAGPKPKFSNKSLSIQRLDTSNRLVEIICYCLMPNHFHLLVKQVVEGGISELMRKFIHSYTKYFDLKHNRFGPLFQPMFKAVHIDTDEQLLHLSRYIHLNPLVSLLVNDLKLYNWSSYTDFIGLRDNTQLSKGEVLGLFKSPAEYQQFVLDQADYGRTLEILKHLYIDADD